MAKEFQFDITLVHDEPFATRRIRRIWEDLERLLADLERSVTGKDRAEVRWKTDDDVHLAMGATPNGVSAATLARVIDAAQEGFARASKAAGSPDWPVEFSQDAREHASNILSELKDLEAIVIEATGHPPLTIESAYVGYQVESRRRPRVRSSVEGRLEMLSRTGSGYRLAVREHLSGRYVRCTFDDELLTKAKAFFDRRVVVEGLVAYDEDGLPLSVIQISDITPREVGGSLRDFRGAVPDLIDGMKIEEFIDEVRS